MVQEEIHEQHFVVQFYRRGHRMFVFLRACQMPVVNFYKVLAYDVIRAGWVV